MYYSRPQRLRIILIVLTLILTGVWAVTGNQWAVAGILTVAGEAWCVHIVDKYGE